MLTMGAGAVAEMERDRRWCLTAATVPPPLATRLGTLHLHHRHSRHHVTGFLWHVAHLGLAALAPPVYGVVHIRLTSCRVSCVCFLASSRLQPSRYRLFVSRCGTRRQRCSGPHERSFLPWPG